MIIGRSTADKESTSARLVRTGLMTPFTSRSDEGKDGRSSDTAIDRDDMLPVSSTMRTARERENKGGLKRRAPGADRASSRAGPGPVLKKKTVLCSNGCGLYTAPGVCPVCKKVNNGPTAESSTQATPSAVRSSRSHTSTSAAATSSQSSSARCRSPLDYGAPGSSKESREGRGGRRAERETIYQDVDEESDEDSDGSDRGGRVYLDRTNGGVRVVLDDFSDHDYHKRVGAFLKWRQLERLSDEECAGLNSAKAGLDDDDEDAPDDSDLAKEVRMKAYLQLKSIIGGEEPDDDKGIETGGGATLDGVDFDIASNPDGFEDAYRQYLDDDKSVKLSERLSVPDHLWKELYPYQRTGVKWLWELHVNDCGGIVGDEMGLGKTAQVVTLLASLKHSGMLKRALIVCPATVMGHWAKELTTWYPPLRVVVFHESGQALSNGRTRRQVLDMVSSRGDADVMVTTYGGVRSFREALLDVRWDYVILDEADRIRNPDADISLTCKQFRTTHRLAMTGSPIQNNLKELWSIFDFAFPGLLGTLPAFDKQFSKPIGRGGYSNAKTADVQLAYQCAKTLRDIICPYLLRRLKKDVNAQLPKKTEQVLFCKLAPEQVHQYRSLINSDKVARIIDGSMMAFQMLVELRKLCNHSDLLSFKDMAPSMYPADYGHPSRSGKLLVLQHILPQWKKDGHKVLLFSQTVQTLKILETFSKNLRFSFLVMDGSTPIRSRQAMVDRFNSDASIFLFILTTKVGGVGVNLTGADRVVIFDPDWNPSTDMQARERAWRLGQTRPVTVYRLMTTGTIEEKIYHRQIFKQYLSSKILSDPKSKRLFNNTTLHDLFTFNEGSERSGTETGSLFVHGEMTKAEAHRIVVEEERKAMRKKGIAVEPDVTKKRGDADFMGEALSGVASSSTKASTARSGEVPAVPLFRVETFKSAEEREREREVEEQVTAREAAKTAGSAAKRLGSASKKDKDSESSGSGAMLRSLFDNTGLVSVFSHDVIESEDRQRDQTLFRQEAARIAQYATEAIKRSRATVQSSGGIGVPTWTGRNGSAGNVEPSLQRRGKAPAPSMRRFGTTTNSLSTIVGSSAVRGSDASSVSSSSSSKAPPAEKGRSSAPAASSSSSKRQSPTMTDGSSAFFGGKDGLKVPSTVETSESLLGNLRTQQYKSKTDPMGAVLDTKAATQAQTLCSDLLQYMSDSYHMRVSTNDILSKFSSQVGRGRVVEPPVFKTLLNNLATLSDGVWTLKPEWRWK